MRWNTELNPYLLQALSDFEERAKLLQTLNEADIEVQQVAELLDMHPKSEILLEKLADSGHPAAKFLICEIFAEAVMASYSVTSLFTEGHLKYIGYRDASPLLAYLQHPSALVRQRFCEVLGQIGNPDAVPALIPLLSDSNELVQMYAIQALSYLKSPLAAPALLAYLQKHESHRLMAALALWQSEDPDTALLAIRDENPAVRSVAAQMMGYIYHQKAIPILLDALHDSEWIVRKKALMNLGRLGDISLLEDLLSLKHDPRPEVRETLITALVELAELEALPYLFQFITDSNPRVRQAILHSLTKLNHPHALPIVEALLNDRSTDVQIYARMLFNRLKQK